MNQVAMNLAGAERMEGGVLCVSSDQRTVSVLTDAAARFGAGEVVRRTLKSHCESGMHADGFAVAFVDIGSDVELSESLVGAFADAAQRVPHVLIVDGSPSIALTRAALRMNAADILEKPLSPEATLRLLGELTNTPRKTSAEMTAVLSAHGGAGGTSIAIALATSLAEERGKAALVDLDHLTGMCGLMLDAASKLDLAEALSEPERVDADFLRTVSRRVGTLQVLSATARGSASTDLGDYRGFWLATLDAMESEFGSIVVDVPSWMSRPMLDALPMMNRVFVACAPTVPALKAATDLHRTLIEAGCPTDDVRLLVNRFRHSLFSSHLDRKTISRMLEDVPHSFLRDDDETLTEAVNTGVPPSEVKKRGRFQRDVTRAFEAAGGRFAAPAHP